ncbi:MAG TPA: isoprenylcysteine carboxylmethyltransferase family protein [Candidatus Hydrogenedentes bacterium]|nr:isoprenylcysteine carboxylmethyltransferase family protein [Candidatus Hydrogenedentota bacterium]
MPLMEEMESSGKWLFRWRSYLPLILVALFLAGLQYFSYPFGSHMLDVAWEMVCLAVSLAGLGIRILTIGYARPHTSGRNTKKQVAESLNTSGMYSIVRNPLYLGNFLVGLGPAMFLRVWWIPVIYLLLFMLYYERIVFTEEMFLRRKFGQAYLDWASRTPAFLPRWRQWHAAEQKFSFRKILRHEHQTLFGIIVAFYAIETVTEVEMGNWPRFDIAWPDPVWNILLAIGLVVFVVIRVLRKVTTLLRDES